MGQGQSGPVGPEGPRGPEGLPAIVDYSVLQSQVANNPQFKDNIKNVLVQDSSFKKSIDDYFKENSTLFKGEKGLTEFKSLTSEEQASIVAIMISNHVDIFASKLAQNVTFQTAVINTLKTIPEIRGKDGTNGTNGTNGINGKDGINGTNGINGRDADLTSANSIQFLKDRALWCADGEVCNIPSGKLGVNLNTSTKDYGVFSIQNDVPGSFVIFKNKSTRQVDGGPNTTTIRNDNGDLRIQASTNKILVGNKHRLSPDDDNWLRHFNNNNAHTGMGFASDNLWAGDRIYTPNMGRQFNKRVNLAEGEKFIPKNTPAGTWQVGFSDTGKADDWHDTMIFNTWGDASGGKTTALALKKSGDLSLKVFRGDFNGTTFNESAEVALRQNNITNLGNAWTIDTSDGHFRLKHDGDQKFVVHKSGKTWVKHGIGFSRGGNWMFDGNGGRLGIRDVGDWGNPESTWSRDL